MVKLKGKFIRLKILLILYFIQTLKFCFLTLTFFTYSYYSKAQQIAPKNGRPYNQLALLAMYGVCKCDIDFDLLKRKNKYLISFSF